MSRFYSKICYRHCNQTIDRSINRSINQSINQSIYLYLHPQKVQARLSWKYTPIIHDQYVQDKGVAEVQKAIEFTI